MARLNSSVMWFLPAVMLWMCMNVEVKANNRGATASVCRLNRSDDRYKSLWTSFNKSLWNLYNEVKGSRSYPLNESDIWKNCTKDLCGNRKKMQQYDHLVKFWAALSIVHYTHSNKLTILKNWTLTDLINSSIWTPDNCTATIKANLNSSCEASLKAPNDDYQKEFVETLVEMAMGTTTGRNRCQPRRRNRGQTSQKPRKQQRKNQKKNKTSRGKKQTPTAKTSKDV